MVSLEQVLSDHAALVSSNRGQWRASARCSVARRIYRRVGNALHVFVYFYPALFSLDLRTSEIEIFDIRNSSGTVHNEVCIKGLSD